MIAVAALAAVVVVVAIAGAYTLVRLGQLKRVAVDGIVPVGSGQPQNILVAGSDSRAGESASAAQHFGSAALVTGQRSDVIIVVHIDPRTAKASMLSIPRDLFVPIAGTASSNRINVAFDQSPGELARTISQDLGITINHYAQEDFSGLQALTGAVGGVCLNFPYPVRDGAPAGPGNESGLNIPTAGRHTLTGAQALAFVRSRYYQYLTGGVWHAEGTGDIGRIERQHLFMRGLASKALHASLRNPFTANLVLSRAVGDVKVDNRFTTIGLLRLGLHLRSLRPAAIPSWTLPYRAVNGYKGYGDVLMPDPAQDAAVVAAWQSYGAPGGAAPPARAAAPGVPPAQVSVRVLNGSGVAGQAQRAADALGRRGFRIGGFGTAPAPASGTTVAYAAGHQGAARAVAGDLIGPVRLVSDRALAGDSVVLTTGRGFAGVRTPSVAAGAASGGGGGAGSSAGGAAGSAAAPVPAAPPWDPTPC